MTPQVRGQVIRLMMRREGKTREEAERAADGFQRIDDSPVLNPSGRQYNWYRGMLETYNSIARAASEPDVCEACGRPLNEEVP